jgi:hypothetical protein
MMRRSLTLIESLVVILVMIVLLFVLDFPFHHGHGREHAKRNVCANNLKQIYKAMETYGQDYKGCFPMITFGPGAIAGEDKLSKDVLHRNKEHSVSENLWLLCIGEFAQAELFICPSSEGAGNKLDPKTRNHVENMEKMKDFPWAFRPDSIITYSFAR